MTESHRDPAQQGASRGEVVGSDVLWVRLRIDRAQPWGSWRELVPALYSGASDTQQGGGRR